MTPGKRKTSQQDATPEIEDVDVYIDSAMNQADSSTVRHYLTWLANRMSERNLTVFRSGDMQSDWLETHFQQSLYRLFARLGYGVIVGTLVGALGVLVGVIIVGVVFGEEIRVSWFRENLYGISSLAY